MSEEKPLLLAADIYKQYCTHAEKIPVLNGLNLEIEFGEIVAVMGPSGAGKSTLLHILGLLDRFDSGSLILDGFSIQSQRDYPDIRARKIGFVFQYHHLLPEFNVLENLMIPQFLIGQSTGNARQRAYELLEAVGLTARASHYPSQISGGEKQRVAVLRAMINQPRLILADEPTGNLDSSTSDTLLDLMLVLRNRHHQSYLIATHDEQVASVADRVLVLQDGQIVPRETRIQE